MSNKEQVRLICKKCGHSDFEYDELWKEYICKNCGWIKNDQKLSEQRERLKDQDGFTLKEQQEWEQLLKEERIQQREKQGTVSNSKTSKQLSTAELALAITYINAIPEKFMEWLNLLLDTYLSQNKKNENIINLLSFELGSARIALYFLMAQNHYFKLYPYSSKLFDAFSHTLQQHFQSIYGDNFKGALSLFKIRLSSYSTAFESNTYEDRFSQLIKLLDFHFNYCLHSSDAFSHKVTPDSDIVKCSLPLGENLGYCVELINHIAAVTNKTFEMYKIVE